MDVVWLEAECSRYEFFADVVGQTTPDIGVVCVDSGFQVGIGIGHGPGIAGKIGTPEQAKVGVFGPDEKMFFQIFHVELMKKEILIL